MPAVTPAGQGKGKPARRNVLRKAADADVHPAEPRMGTSASSSRGSSSGARSGRSSAPNAGGRTGRD